MDAPQGELPPPWIQTPPAGWLGYLGIKSGGRQPGHVTQDLVSTLDMDRFYRAGVRTKLFGPGPGVPMVFNGQSVFVTVPTGKIWLCEDWTVNSGAWGAVAATVLVAFLTDPSGGIVLCGQQSPNRSQTGELSVSVLKGPFIAMPGQSLACYTLAPAAPTATNLFGTVFGVEVSA